MGVDRWVGFEMHRSLIVNRRSEAAGNTDRLPDQPNRRRLGGTVRVLLGYGSFIASGVTVRI